MKKSFRSFMRQESPTGEWDSMCVKCFRVLTAEGKDELSNVEAAHKCEGIRLTTLLHPGDPHFDHGSVG